MSALFGVDPVTREVPADAAAEAEQMFANLEAILGITMRALQRGRPVFNRVWAERFGDHRPARGAVESPDFGRPGENARFMVEVTAHRG